MAKEKI